MALVLEPSAEESIVLTLFDLANHLAKNGERMAAREGLTVRQWMVLLQVAGDPNFPEASLSEGLGGEVTASQIASDRGVTRANVSALISALVEKGVLQQTESEGDRRRKQLRITSAGRRALERLEVDRRGANRALFSGWTQEQLDELLAMLEGCRARLTPNAADAVAV